MFNLGKIFKGWKGLFLSFFNLFIVKKNNKFVLMILFEFDYF